ncbi:hypothetical protein F3D3_3724 [Fusibacter sp. 3D3]|nr:hypothetical protein F3D3_3724 [Fusibacter sp. 3D3]
MSIERYSVIDQKNPREIVLLKSRRCQWGICTFCDYIHDNSEDELEIVTLNQSVLKKITGKHHTLEVINSGSCFELPEDTLRDIKLIIEEKQIEHLYLESHYMYRDRLEEMRSYFKIPITFKCGIETFDDYFRNKVLKKGVTFKDPEAVSNYFSSICLMVGIKGQTREMIQSDIQILLKYFKQGCINIYQDNSTQIKSDPELIQWFKETYLHLEVNPFLEILWHNTDFGVGGIKHE